MKRIKDYNSFSLICIVIGLLLFGTGLYRLINGNIVIGSHYKTTELRVSNGLYQSFIGGLLLLIGIYRFIKRKKFLKQFEQIEKESNRNRK